jgi:hypothetical protein
VDDQSRVIAVSRGNADQTFWSSDTTVRAPSLPLSEGDTSNESEHGVRPRRAARATNSLAI